VNPIAESADNLPNASGSIRGLTSRRDHQVRIKVRAGDTSKLVVSGNLR
jgi:hypothetical protein